MNKLLIIGIISLSLYSCGYVVGDKVIQEVVYSQEKDTLMLSTNAWSCGDIVYSNYSIFDSAMVEYYQKKANYILKLHKKRIK